MTAVTSSAVPTLFAPHGAPTFVLNPGAAGAALQQFAANQPKPSAIVVLSAHWSTPQPTVGICPEPETIHDFWGFPRELYALHYRAAGSAAVAQQVAGLLAGAGWPVRLDQRQGLDHGAWTPLMLMYPQADIPVIPLSINAQEGPEYHYRLGQALAPLTQQGVLVLASGNVTHNLYHYQQIAMRGGQTPAYVTEFPEWIAQALAQRDIPALLDYRQQAAGAEAAHPTDEHLLPLYVALGAAGQDYRSERLFQGTYDHVIAMDAYAFYPAAA